MQSTRKICERSTATGWRNGSLVCSGGHRWRCAMSIGWLDRWLFMNFYSVSLSPSLCLSHLSLDNLLILLTNEEVGNCDVATSDGAHQGWINGSIVSNRTQWGMNWLHLIYGWRIDVVIWKRLLSCIQFKPKRQIATNIDLHWSFRVWFWTRVLTTFNMSINKRYFVFTVGVSFLCRLIIWLGRVIDKSYTLTHPHTWHMLCGRLTTSVHNFRPIVWSVHSVLLTCSPLSYK